MTACSGRPPALLRGSVRVEAKVNISHASAEDAAGIYADLAKQHTGDAILASLANQAGFDQLKEDPRKPFTVAAVSVAETVEEGAQETRESDFAEIGRAAQERRGPIRRGLKFYESYIKLRIG